MLYGSWNRDIALLAFETMSLARGTASITSKIHMLCQQNFINAQNLEHSAKYNFTRQQVQHQCSVLVLLKVCHLSHLLDLSLSPAPHRQLPLLLLSPLPSQQLLPQHLPAGVLLSCRQASTWHAITLYPPSSCVAPPKPCHKYLVHVLNLTASVVSSLAAYLCMADKCLYHLAATLGCHSPCHCTCLHTSLIRSPESNALKRSEAG